MQRRKNIVEKLLNLVDCLAEFDLEFHSELYLELPGHTLIRTIAIAVTEGITISTLEEKEEEEKAKKEKELIDNFEFP